MKIVAADISIDRFRIKVHMHPTVTVFFRETIFQGLFVNVHKAVKMYSAVRMKLRNNQPIRNHELMGEIIGDKRTTIHEVITVKFTAGKRKCAEGVEV